MHIHTYIHTYIHKYNKLQINVGHRAVPGGDAGVRENK